MNKNSTDNTIINDGYDLNGFNEEAPHGSTKEVVQQNNHLIN